MHRPGRVSVCVYVCAREHAQLMVSELYIRVQAVHASVVQQL